MNTLFHRSHSRNRGAAMLAVLAFTIIGGIAVTAWTYLLAARAIQASRMSDSVARHITWGNTAAINQQYNFAFAYRDTVTQPELIATLTGGGGEVAAAFTNLSAFASANTYSNPASFAAPFNNIRKQITADNSVYYTRTTATSDNSQTEHLLYYNFQKSYPRPLLGDLLIVYAKPSGAANTYITDNLKVNGRVLLYDSTADTAGVAANECLNLTKTGTNTTVDSSGHRHAPAAELSLHPALHRRLGGQRHRRGADRCAQRAEQFQFHAPTRSFTRCRPVPWATDDLSTSSTSGVNIESDV